MCASCLDEGGLCNAQCPGGEPAQSATLDAFEKWWKANAYKFPQADYASSSYEEIARAAWEASRSATLQNAAPQASSTQDSTRTGDDIGPSARHPTEKETGGAPAVAAPETMRSETPCIAEPCKIDGCQYGRLAAEKLLGTTPSATPQKWVVWAHEHQAYWPASRCGYAPLHEAGQFTFAEALAIVQQGNYGMGSAPEETMMPAPGRPHG